MCITGSGSNSQTIKPAPLSRQSLKLPELRELPVRRCRMELHYQKPPPCMNYSDSFFASRLETDLGLCGCVKLQTRNPTPAPLWRGYNTASWPLLQNPSQLFQPRFAFFKSFGHLCLRGAFRNPKLLNSPANSGNAFPDPTLVGFDDVSAASPDGSSVCALIL